MVEQIAVLRKDYHEVAVSPRWVEGAPQATGYVAEPTAGIH